MNNNENNKENINKNELGEVSGGLSTSDENMKEPRPFCGAGDLKFPIKTIDPKTGKISGKDEKNKKEGLSDNDLNAASGGTTISRVPKSPLCWMPGPRKLPLPTPKTDNTSGKDEKNKKESLSDNDLNAASGGTTISTVKRVKDPETGEWKIMHYNMSTGEWVECGRLLKKNIDPETTEPKNTNGIKT